MRAGGYEKIENCWKRGREKIKYGGGEKTGFEKPIASKPCTRQKNLL
jgi:hypothetical protein